MPGTWCLELVDENARPLAEPELITQWLKTQTAELIIPDSVLLTQRCAFCYRWDGGEGGHELGTCPTLRTFNKRREAKGFMPISAEDGNLLTDLKKKPLTLETVAKRLEALEKEQREKIGASPLLALSHDTYDLMTVVLEKRVADLEAKAGIKRKAPPATAAEAVKSSPPPKKRKEQEPAKPKAAVPPPTAGPSAPKKTGPPPPAGVTQEQQAKVGEAMKKLKKKKGAAKEVSSSSAA